MGDATTSDHKFEPFDKVLVRDEDAHNWTGLLYSHKIGDIHMCGDMSWKQCIPYTPETAHLLGTSKPYEPPVDEATRFKAGQLVEVARRDERWDIVMYLEYLDGKHRVYDFITTHKTYAQPPEEIRPLPID